VPENHQAEDPAVVIMEATPHLQRPMAGSWGYRTPMPLRDFMGAAVEAGLPIRRFRQAPFPAWLVDGLVVFTGNDPENTTVVDPTALRRAGLRYRDLYGPTP
jgi:hypothetical protein